MKPTTPAGRSLKNVAVLGATGSVGTSALDVIARHPDRFRVSALVAHSRVDELVSLCGRFRPSLAVIADTKLEGELAAKLKAADVTCDVAGGSAAVTAAAASQDCDIVIAAIAGAAGLTSTLAAARAGKRLLLANKESIVMAGPLLLAAVSAGGGDLIPVDSEHNAIYQCLPGRQPNLRQMGVRRLILTASGGPFLGRTREALSSITPSEAIAHPTWQMGPKISVDSATLMNKGLEVIEAHFLFGAPADDIDVLVHPQSMVHSLVEYADGSVLAQLGNPDMRTAIAHGLAWPERISSGVPALDLGFAGRLDFVKPDLDTFRCLDLAFQALRQGGDAPVILNAANEVAVSAFLACRLPFLGIADVVEAALSEMTSMPITDVESVLDCANATRDVAKRAVLRFERGDRKTLSKPH